MRLEIITIHIHLDELRDYKTTKWRDKCLRAVKQRNEATKEQYSLMPSVNTCLFCFNERNKDIVRNIQQESPYAFCLPSTMIKEVEVDEKGGGGGKHVNGGVSNSITIDESRMLNGHAEKKTSTSSSINSFSIGKEKQQRNLLSSGSSTKSKKTAAKQGKLLRSGYFSDKLLRKFTKKEVAIDLESEDAPLNKSNVLSDCVNIVLMYPDDDLTNSTTNPSSAPLTGTSTGGAGIEGAGIEGARSPEGEKVYVVEESGGGGGGPKEKRIVRRNFDGKGEFEGGKVIRGSSVEENGNNIDDDDEDDDSFVEIF